MISLIAALLMLEFWEVSPLFIVGSVGTHPTGHMKIFMK